MRRARVTSRDVAKIAGVSYNTVSLVMHDSPLVLPETKARVRAAAEKLGYQPNAAAAALRSSRSQTIGYLVQREPQALIDEEVDVLRNRSFKAISDCAEAHNYYVLQTSFIDSQRCISLYNSGRVDGLLIDFYIPDEIVYLLAASKVPLVLIGRGDHQLSVSWVKADEEEGAFVATTHLLTDGHRRIALLTAGQADHPLVREREHGFHRALQEARCIFEPHYLVNGGWLFEGGYTQMCHLLALPEPPTAIFALNELMAAGCMQAVQDRGLRVPQDIAIVTTEDSFWVRYVRPQLTAVHVPMYEVAQQATEILLQQLSQSFFQLRHVTIPTTFTVRESSRSVK
jgi:LacI family transcriptional regulator